MQDALIAELNLAKWPGGRMIEFGGRRPVETRIEHIKTTPARVVIVGTAFTFWVDRAVLETERASDPYPAGSVILYGPMGLHCVIIPAAHQEAPRP